MKNEKLDITVNGVPYYKLEDIEKIILARLNDEKKDNNLIRYSDDYKQGFDECEHFVKLVFQHIEDAEASAKSNKE